jgi:hypothetical protein
MRENGEPEVRSFFSLFEWVKGREEIDNSGFRRQKYFEFIN